MTTSKIITSAIAVFMLLSVGAKAQDKIATAKEIPYTLDDRDRMIRMEQKFDGFQKEMDTRFAAIDQRFASLQTLIYFILGGIIGLITLIFWDRRSYIKPVKEDISEITAVLREFARKQPELNEILRAHGLS